MTSREILTRFRAQTLRYERRVGEWAKEFKAMNRDAKTSGSETRWVVPAKGFPLMAATRHAIEMLLYAKAEYHAHTKQGDNHPDIKVI